MLKLIVARRDSIRNPVFVALRTTDDEHRSKREEAAVGNYGQGADLLGGSTNRSTRIVAARRYLDKYRRPPTKNQAADANEESASSGRYEFNGFTRYTCTPSLAASS